MQRPVKQGVITQGYSAVHFGIDIGVPGNPDNVPVYAARDGVIAYINNDISAGVNAGGGFGRVVYIIGVDRYYSIYAHLYLVNYDNKVGQMIHERESAGHYG